ncbi:MAG: response regulator [Magnetococcales bacterium]|nr:response regulator [Magnetococcales bacterium]
MSLEQKILLVEDDPAAVRIALHAFAKSGLGEERIVVARDGREALRRLSQGTPRMVLLDLKLPRVGGLEVLECIRQEEHTRDIPVIVLTNSDDDQDVVRSYDLGANSYLRKPVDFHKLVALLKQLGMVPA